MISGIPGLLNFPAPTALGWNYWCSHLGVIHAFFAVTFEPQWNSDVNTIMENVTMESESTQYAHDCAPENEKNDLGAIFSQINWEESTRPDYKETHFRAPKVKSETSEAVEKWVAYANEWVAAKEVTILPGQSYTLFDQACYCAIVVQGHGTFGVYECEAPELVRFDDITPGSYFVSNHRQKRCENHEQKPLSRCW